MKRSFGKRDGKRRIRKKKIREKFSDQSSVRRITKKLKEIDVDEQLRKKRKVLHR